MLQHTHTLSPALISFNLMMSPHLDLTPSHLDLDSSLESMGWWVKLYFCKASYLCLPVKSTLFDTKSGRWHGSFRWGSIKEAEWHHYFWWLHPLRLPHSHLSLPLPLSWLEGQEGQIWEETLLCEPLGHYKPLPNATAPSLLGHRWNLHIIPILQSLHWLLISYQVQFKILVIIYKAFLDLRPYIYRTTPPQQLHTSVQSLQDVPPRKCVKSILLHCFPLSVILFSALLDISHLRYFSALFLIL